MGRVAIFCEESATVREAFKEAGHDAWSFDILPTRIEGQHIQGDCTPYLKEHWDLIIVFPPCTDLAVSGARHFKKKIADGSQQKSVDFFLMFTKFSGRFCIENPVGIMSTMYRKPDQIIQPWQFGHEAQKKTCLWLNQLPKLIPTKITSRGNFLISKSGKKYPEFTHGAIDVSGKKIGFHTQDMKKIRSKTFEGIAKAMADQWGKLLPVILLLLTLNLSSQVQLTNFNDLTSFDKHRVVTTGISWTGTVIGYKATGKIWKGALIGFGASMAIGAGKEAYDMTARDFKNRDSNQGY